MPHPDTSRQPEVLPSLEQARATCQRMLTQVSRSAVPVVTVPVTALKVLLAATVPVPLAAPARIGDPPTRITLPVFWANPRLDHTFSVLLLKELQVKLPHAQVLLDPTNPQDVICVKPGDPADTGNTEALSALIQEAANNLLRSLGFAPLALEALADVSETEEGAPTR